MKRVLTAVVLIPIVFAILFLAPPWLFIACLGVIAVLATREFLQIGKLHGCLVFDRTVLILVALGYAAGTIASTLSGGDDPSAPFVVVFMLFFLVAPFLLLVAALGAREQSRTLPGVALSYFAFFYVALPLASLQVLRELSGHGDFFVLVVLITVWSGDIAAFYVGSNFGRHKLAPTISPGKSWEGTLASFLVATGACWALLHWMGPKMPAFRASSSEQLVAPPAVVALGIGACINVAAQLGDLIESMMKRGAGIKDSGSLLPGHGGVLDRIDALLFAAPTGMLLFIVAHDFFLHY